MNVGTALSALGASRVIWIDDYFTENPSELSELLFGDIETTRACSFPGVINDLLDEYEFDPDGTTTKLTQALLDLGEEKRSEIRQQFFTQEQSRKGASAQELASTHVSVACSVLNVSSTDRWNFNDVQEKLKLLCEEGDDSVGYVIDLNNASGSDRQGLEVLKFLGEHRSRGTAFILTHETSIDGEETLEHTLRAELREGTSKNRDIPICVIAKQRLTSENGDETSIDNALRVAIKRAGLRRSMNEVLQRAREDVLKTFDSASDMLLDIPPEQLEKYVVDRGRDEGVSELHVVERVITATMAQTFREIFASDEQVKRSTVRLRALRGVPLPVPSMRHKHLDAFRKMEVWESDSLINQTHSPIACGDVFELDDAESSTGTKKMFVLLAQPCDISLRPNGKRDLDSAFLVPMKSKDIGPEDKKKLKEAILPFTLDGKKLVCDLRSAASAKLSILDLASFRSDGRVRYDKDQPSPDHLLPGLEVAFVQRKEKLQIALEHEVANATDEHDKSGKQGVKLVNPELQLTVSGSDIFKKICYGAYKNAVNSKAKTDGATLPERITWSLRRCGRIRMPYAASLLKDYLVVMGRDAFDLDFTSEMGGQDATSPKSSACTPCSC